MINKLFACGALTVLLLAYTLPTAAQIEQDTSSARQLAVGAHFGVPTGLSMKLETDRHSYDALLAWNLEDFFVAQTHVWLVEESLTSAHHLNYYAGPGIAVQGRDGTLYTGLSANAGVAFQISTFEFFVQVSPLLNIVPSTSGDINAGAGFRIFL